MTEAMQKLEFRFERMIPASPREVYDGWLDPSVPGNPWNIADKLLLDPKIDGFFYWTMKGTAHYGRFIAVEPGSRLQHTWMSRNTLGEESTVTVTFEAREEGTLMTLIHSGLPDNEKARSHQKGWEYFLGIFPEQFGKSTGH